MLPGTLNHEPDVEIAIFYTHFNNHERGLGPGNGVLPYISHIGMCRLEV